MSSSGHLIRVNVSWGENKWVWCSTMFPLFFFSFLFDFLFGLILFVVIIGIILIVLLAIPGAERVMQYKKPELRLYSSPILRMGLSPSAILFHYYNELTKKTIIEKDFNHWCQFNDLREKHIHFTQLGKFDSTSENRAVIHIQKWWNREQRKTLHSLCLKIGRDICWGAGLVVLKNIRRLRCRRRNGKEFFLIAEW